MGNKKAPEKQADSSAAENDPADEELMARVGGGDHEAFAVLVDRYSAKLFRFFYRHTFSAAAGEDLAQECLIRVFQAAGSYRPQAKFTTWLFRVARNLWIDHVRKNIRRGKVTSLDAVLDDSRSRLEQLPADQLTPEEIHTRTELADDLVKAIDQLSEEHKTVLLLSVLDDLKYSDIGDALGIPVGTVKSRIFHAVNKLRDMLKGSEYDPEARGKNK